ncbi:hypothetical protein BJ742DRAFT_817224 [Cladochytrium replicatum]|nr:hypothetical protein BJ742DRAFT_817224 [Cladochytrium replicatum]
MSSISGSGIFSIGGRANPPTYASAAAASRSLYSSPLVSPNVTLSDTGAPSPPLPPRRPTPLSINDTSNEPFFGGNSRRERLLKSIHLSKDGNPPLLYRANGPIAALSPSPDRESVVVAGKEVLTILSVTDNEVSMKFNLRVGSKANPNALLTDVRWGNKNYPSTIAAAAADGSVMFWDINRPSQNKHERTFNEHNRGVNRICFHPTEPLILSGSQDGTIKLWDLRGKRIIRQTIESPQKDIVRDVQFNPVPGNPVAFAAGFDSGVIQTWEMRNSPTAQVLRKWKSANRFILSVDWHPDGRYVASGGGGNAVEIWDTNSESRKAAQTIPTPCSIGRLQWRLAGSPIGRAGASHGYTKPTNFHRDFSSVQLAGSSWGDEDLPIFIWDLRRPYIARYTVDIDQRLVTGLQWKDEQNLWVVSRDKTFGAYNLLRHSARFDENLNGVAVRWSPSGSITFAIEAGGKRAVCGGGLVTEWGDEKQLVPRAPPTSTSSSVLSSKGVSPPSADLLPSATAGAASIVQAISTLLDIPEEKGSPQTYSAGPPPAGSRRAGNRRGGSSPSSTSGVTPDTHSLSLDQVPVYRPMQSIGTMPNNSSFDQKAFLHMATNYRISNEDIFESCAHNARISTEANQFRTGQTWRIIQLLFGTNPVDPVNLSMLGGGHPTRLTPKHHQEPTDYDPENKPRRWDMWNPVDETYGATLSMSPLPASTGLTPPSAGLSVFLAPTPPPREDGRSPPVNITRPAMSRASSISQAYNPAALNPPRRSNSTIPESESPNAMEVNWADDTAIGAPRPRAITVGAIRSRTFPQVNSTTSESSRILLQQPVYMHANRPIFINGITDLATTTDEDDDDEYMKNLFLLENSIGEVVRPDSLPTGASPAAASTSTVGVPSAHEPVENTEKAPVASPPLESVPENPAENQGFETEQTEESSTEPRDIDADSVSSVLITSSDIAGSASSSFIPPRLQNEENASMVSRNTLNEGKKRGPADSMRQRTSVFEHRNSQNWDEMSVEGHSLETAGSEQFFSRSLDEKSILPPVAENPTVESEPPDVYLPAFDVKPVLRDVLQYYAHQGNVQMCATLLLVVRDHAVLQVTSDTEKEWIWAYVDLLHRFRLWKVATAVINVCGIEELKDRNQVGFLEMVDIYFLPFNIVLKLQTSTTIYTSCQNCRKPLQNSETGSATWWCERCKRVNNSCSVW